MRKRENSRNSLLLCGLLFVFPAICPAADGDASKTAGAALEVRSASALIENEASNDVPEPPSPPSARKESGLAGVGLRLSTLGAGAEVGVSLGNRLNLRAGFNIFQYHRGFHHDGITYQGQLNLRSGEAHLDWYPVGHTFHLSPGLLVYNGNGATANAHVPGGSTFTLGGATYTSDPTNPITGTGKLDFVKAAPSAMFGFGNLVPESRHFTYNLRA